MKSLEDIAAKLKLLEERQAQIASQRVIDNVTGQEVVSHDQPQSLVLPDLPDDYPQEVFDYASGDPDDDFRDPRTGEGEGVHGLNGRAPDPCPAPGEPQPDIFAGGHAAGLVAVEAPDDELFADDPPLLPPSGQRLFR
jgi:hypothetical protein